MRSTIIMLAAGLTLGLLTACAASVPEGPPISITAATEAHLKQYLQTVGDGDNYGAFAVSPNGHYAYYTYCVDGGGCERVPLNFDALAGCKKLAGTDCIVLAHNRSFLRPYHVAG